MVGPDILCYSLWEPFALFYPNCLINPTSSSKGLPCGHRRRYWSWFSFSNFHLRGNRCHNFLVCSFPIFFLLVPFVLIVINCVDGIVIVFCFKFHGPGWYENFGSSINYFWEVSLTLGLLEKVYIIIRNGLFGKKCVTPGRPLLQEWLVGIFAMWTASMLLLWCGSIHVLQKLVLLIDLGKLWSEPTYLPGLKFQPDILFISFLKIY